jgi:hypothetical protein
VIFFWGLRLSLIDPQSASLKKVKPRWGTLFHCPEKTSDSSTLHLLRCFLPRGAGCEPENLLLELRLPHFNLWIFFKSSSPHTGLHLRSCVSCRFCTRRLNGVPHLWVRGRQRRWVGLHGTRAAALIRFVRGHHFLAWAYGALIGNAALWKVLDTTRS